MRTGKKLLALLLLVLLPLSGCVSRPAETERHSVAMVVKSTETEFWKSVFAGANAASSEYNIDLTITGPETEEDYETQNQYIEEAVDSGVDAIVFSAISYEENAAAIDAAAARGVKIVVIDSDVDSEHVSVRIGTDNVAAGRQAAAAALDTKEETLVIGLVNYAQVSRNGQEREWGFREAALEDSRVAGIYTVNALSTQEDAEERAAELLREHPEINVLVGFNEPTSVGAARAVAGQALEDCVRMVGFDSNVITVDLMQSGAVDALIVQNPYAMGYLGVEAAYGLLNGETYNAAELMDTPTSTVTRENMFDIENQKVLFSFN